MRPYTTTFDASSTSLADETKTLCPHLEAVTIVQGASITQVAPSGVLEFAHSEGKSMRGRGTCVCLTFHTEDGRRFFRTFQFHKGDVYVTTTDPETMQPWEYNPDAGIAPPELWRD